MKIAAYIPIKLNNERAPGKNIKKFDDGTPLCEFMFETISRVKEIDEIYCFCSDETGSGKSSGRCRCSRPYRSVCRQRDPAGQNRGG